MEETIKEAMKAEAMKQVELVAKQGILSLIHI